MATESGRIGGLVLGIESGSILDVGAGEEPDERADYTADLYDVGVDYVFDIREPWPFPDNTFGGIIARHVFEHVPHSELRTHVLPEVARVLEPGGWFELRVPLGCDAVADPTHESLWAWRTPLFYSDGHRHWTAETGLELKKRRLHIWMITPLEVFTPAIRFGAKHWPMEFWYELPGATGELICTYRHA